MVMCGESYIWLTNENDKEGYNVINKNRGEYYWIDYEIAIKNKYKEYGKMQRGIKLLSKRKINKERN